MLDLTPQSRCGATFSCVILLSYALQKVLISCEIRTFSVLLRPITYLLFFLTQTLTPTGADSGKDYTAPERMLPIVFAASRLAEVVTCA